MDSNYANLYQDTLQALQQRQDLNLLADAEEGEGFMTYTIFESFIPSASYDTLQFNMSGELAFLTSRSGATQLNVEMETTVEDLKIRVPTSFSVDPGGLVEVHLQVQAYSSLERFIDVFRFVPQVTVENIQNSGSFR